jgi:quercetin dioxygenase-like cupin family protein
MVPEARLEDSGSGLAPVSEGWFVVNVRDARWSTAENDELKPPGSDCRFESRESPFAQLGVKIRVLEPGQPNGLYHSENQQEDFLVLSGECRVIVEGEERLLHQWDFVHCPRERVTSSSAPGRGRARS